MKLLNNKNNKHKDIILGENTFRRGSREAFISMLKCIEENNGNEINNQVFFDKLVENNVFSKKKNKNLSRSISLLNRMGLVTENKKPKLTDLGKEIIVSELGNINFTILKSLIIQSEKNTTNILGFLKNIFFKIVSKKKWKDIFVECQNSPKKTNISSFEEFKNWTIKNLNKKTEKQKLDIKNKLLFWDTYKNLCIKIKNKTNEKILLSEYYDLVKLYFRVSGSKGWKRIKEVEFKSLGLPFNFTSRQNKEKIIKLFNKENFLWTENKEIISEKCNIYTLHYSLDDNSDITKRFLSWTEYMIFYKKNKHEYVEIKPEYKEFINIFIDKYDEFVSIVLENPNVKEEKVYKYFEIKKNNIIKKDIKDIINSVSIEKINDIINSFGTKLLSNKINEIRDFNFNIVNTPTWFEYFIMLKIIHLSKYKLDYKIWNGGIDGNLMPRHFASGGKADIEFIFKDKNCIIEVTTTSGSNQHKLENRSVKSHMHQLDVDKCFFIAPEIDESLQFDLENGLKISGKVYETKGKINFYSCEQFSNVKSLETELE